MAWAAETEQALKPGYLVQVKTFGDAVWNDAGYAGIEKRNEHKDSNVDWFIACPPAS